MQLYYELYIVIFVVLGSCQISYCFFLTKEECIEKIKLRNYSFYFTTSIHLLCILVVKYYIYYAYIMYSYGFFWRQMSMPLLYLKVYQFVTQLLCDSKVIIVSFLSHLVRIEWTNPDAGGNSQLTKYHPANDERNNIHLP